MKPNIGIATFLGIQIAKNHIPRNLDAINNMDSPVPNTTLICTKDEFCVTMLKKYIKIKKERDNLIV